MRIWRMSLSTVVMQWVTLQNTALADVVLIAKQIIKTGVDVCDIFITSHKMLL